MTDEPSLPSIPGMPDLGGIMESFQKVQEARSQIYEGSAGGGAVVVRGAGDLSFESVKIRADVVDPSDVEMLEDLVLAALHDAVRKIGEAQQSSLGGLLPPGMDGLLGQ